MFMSNVDSDLGRGGGRGGGVKHTYLEATVELGHIA